VPLISRVLTAVAGHRCTVSVSVASPDEPPAGPSRAQETATFQRFVVGGSNREAFEHAAAVATGEFRGPGPLVLYGGVGLGKTHLAGAIANALRGTSSSRVVVCEPCTDFVDRLLATVGGAVRPDSWATLRDVAVLILDDIHFLEGHPAVQETLIQVFAILHERGACVVLTSDRLPQRIPDLDQRLRERFDGGVMAQIRPPELDLRRRILLQKATDHGIELPAEVADLLAERVVGSGRALEGALTRVCAYANAQRGTPVRLTRTLAAAALRAFDLPRTSVSVELISAVVAESRGLTPRALSSRSRTREVTAARQLAMYLCRKLLRMPLLEIAHRFGRRDHTTVLHACEVVETKRAADPAFDAAVDQLEALIQARAR
jgi:chromosomal replication initiator protein